MRGFVFTSLRQFVVDAHGEGAWDEVMKDAALAGRTFLASRTYPDGQLVALVAAGSRRTGLPQDELLRAFGRSLAAGLFKMYGPFIKASWGALDLIAEVETHIHKAVRLADKDATPPQLRATRTAKNEVVVEYGSARKFCALAEGIVYGVGDHYAEPITIDHTTCMLRGDATCTLVTRTA